MPDTKAGGRSSMAAGGGKKKPRGGRREGAGRKPGQDTYKPEYAHIARLMCANGATDADLADVFEVNTSTIWRWQARHADFCNALKVAKGEYDDRVERSLAQRAVGYSFDAVKIFMPKDADEPVYAPYREHVPPDPGAAKIWLCNRRSDVWRDKQTVEHDATSGFAALLEKIGGSTARLVE